MIEIIKVDNKDSGNLKAYDILKEVIDPQTLLALSGGTSPDYRRMIVEPPTPPRSAEQSYEGRGILPGAVCLIDERWGEPLHKDSNELLLEDAGVFDYCQRWGIEFYKILSGRGFAETAKDYNEVILGLFEKFEKKVGVMGIGSDLHTAGIFPQSPAIESADLVRTQTVEDKLPLRITLTFKALGEFQNFIILMFGEEKKKALRIMLDDSENDMQKYPAIFYRKSPIVSYLVTDCDIK